MSSDKEIIKKLIKRQDRLEAENMELRKRVVYLENRLKLYEGPNSPSSSQPIFKKEKKSKSKPSGAAKRNHRKPKGREKGHKGV